MSRGRGRTVTGIYGLPGGRVNEHENERQAAAREFQEETGLTAEETDFSEFEKNFQGDLKASSETIPVWVSLKQVEKLESKNKLAPNVLGAINAALD